MEKNTGAKGVGPIAVSAEDRNSRPPTLSDLGITKQQSSRFHALAGVPDDLES